MWKFAGEGLTYSGFQEIQEKARRLINVWNCS